MEGWAERRAFARSVSLWVPFRRRVWRSARVVGLQARGAERWRSYRL